MKLLEELLAEALARPPDERGPYLDQVCSDDPGLRREVEELLAVEDRAAEFFAGLSGDIAGAAPLELESAAHPRMRIGPYQAVAAIGRGGMGVVHLAERVDGVFDQLVALKLLHRDMDTPHLRARFLAERQLLAQLSHPNIARLLDGGVTDEGRPYFVMEHIEGVPITRYCQQHDLTVDQVLRLFLATIDAVSYLHRNLVVHRDLKPSNILVDRDGQVKLLDFGIAKLLGDEPEEGGRTRTGELLMTPEYAAPEQLSGAPVTTATDVYALGVVMYELLTGRRPHERSAMECGAPSRPLPPTPSSMLRSRRRRRDAASTAKPEAAECGEEAAAPRRIAGDLDSICLKALRPEPEARYPSAEQMGRDIGRHLTGRPVQARRATAGYRLGKFVRRHRVGVVVSAGVLALIAGGFARERALRGQAERARVEAQEQAARAVAVSGFLTELLSSVDPMKAQGREVTVADVLEQAAARIADSDEMAAQPTVEATLRRTIATTYMGLGRYAEAREHLERALALRGGLESGDPEALLVARNLGSLYGRLGLPDKAEEMLQKVLQIQEATLGEDDPAVLTTMTQLADVYWSQERYQEVEAIDRRALAIRRRVLGEDHPETLQSLNGLAANLFVNGRYGEAAELFEQALEVARRIHGDTHPHTLVLAGNLATTYTEMGLYAKAEPMLREVVAVQTRVVGPEHEATALSIHNLGVNMAQQGRYTEAEALLRRAAVLREALPNGRQGVLYSQSHLADVLREMGRLEEAEALYLSTIAAQREQFGRDHPHTLKSLEGLARLRLLQGEVGAADELAQQVLSATVAAKGEGHPDTVAGLILMARVRNRQERYGEALELGDRAVQIGARALSANHPVVLTAALERARALAGLRQRAAALELAVHVRRERAALLGEEHPATVEADGLVLELEAPAGSADVDAAG